MYERFEELGSVRTKEERLLQQNFISNIYYYYLKGGLYSIIISKILNIFSLLFLSTFLMTVFIFLDWGRIMVCDI